MLGRNVEPPDIVKPLMLTISPKTWKLLDTEKAIINETIRSISIPEHSEMLSLVQYKVWDAKIDSYSFSSSGISFMKFDSGIYLKIEGVKFHASARIEVGIVNNSWIQWLPLSSLRGGINIASYNVGLKAKMVWDDFKFTPNISIKSNIRLTFTNHFEILNTVEPLLKDMIAKIIDKKVAEELNEAVKNFVNPHLQQLKDKVSHAGYGFLIKGPMKWTVQNSTLQITFRGRAIGTMQADIWTLGGLKLSLEQTMNFDHEFERYLEVHEKN
ncbi:unnamed protein product [Cylicocyclus nassatus]|uniref:Uncharacterized protein n=1 Tax=Cylicocyclus nassatus TaxID=53992 RepID=A0AA36DQ90_CYLNA|nr:unnamed protein product [Cylicocyclus nassatus]